MKTSLQYLPEEHQEELLAITERIKELVNPEMVILFGSFARGDYVNDIYVENGTTYQYKSDYDIMVITENAQDMPAGFGRKVRRKIRRSEWLETPITIIFHDISHVNNALEDGQYFFTELVLEGVQLYDSGKVTLATPKILSPAERKQKAILYFDKWFVQASQSLEGYFIFFEKAYFNKSAFELHQACECYFMTVLLVFTDYKPKLHDLTQLYPKVCVADTRFKTIFPNQSEEEKRRFKVLADAYIDSRYKLDYTVSREDLQWLAGGVELLKELTKTICEEKIAAYAMASN